MRKAHGLCAYNIEGGFQTPNARQFFVLDRLVRETSPPSPWSRLESRLGSFHRPLGDQIALVLWSAVTPDQSYPQILTVAVGALPRILSESSPM